MPGLITHLSKAPSKLRSAWPRWRGRLLAFFVGQLSAQAISLATGFLLLRWMSESEYAKTGVVFGFQTIFSAFVDLGIGGALVSCIGTRSGSPDVVGNYIAAARWWRRALMLLVLPAGALAFFLIYGNQGWPFGETLTLFLCVALSLYFSGWTAWASAPLLLQNRLGAMYFAANAGAVLRLVGCAALYSSGRLSAVSLGLLGVLVGGLSALLYWRAAHPFINEPASSDRVVRTELRKLVSPLIPNTVFYAVQGQVGMLLISSLGTAQGIAEVSALGRLGQVFTLMGAFYGMLIGPYFAQLPQRGLAVRYTLVTGVTVLIALLVTALAFAFPHAILIVLGNRYQHLVHEVGWLVLGTTISLVGGAIWTIHVARKWIFWTTTLMNIILAVAVQALFIAFADMGTTIAVIYMGVGSSAAALLTQAATGYLGFRSQRTSRAIANSESVIPGPD
jgi:O-antigen/teichoic acid export membrane protein